MAENLYVEEPLVTGIYMSSPCLLHSMLNNSVHIIAVIAFLNSS